MTIVTLLFFSSFAAADDDYTPYVSLRGTPHALEPVTMEAYIGGCSHIEKVEFDEGAFNVVVEPDALCWSAAPEGLFPAQFALGALPAGTYRARLVEGTTISSQMTFTVAPPKNPGSDALSNHSGIWWDSRRNGESFFVEHETGPDKLRLVWNTYDSAGNQQWLVGLPDPDSGDEYLHRYDLVLYRPSPAGMQRTGTAFFAGTHEEHFAAFQFQLAGGEPERLHLRRFIGDRTQTYTNEEDFAIADHGTVESPITVSGRSGAASSNASVSVGIRHPRGNDLKVDLVAPDGSLYGIHDPSDGGTGGISTTVSLDLSNETFNGTWKLRVNDQATGDTGDIVDWSITF